MPRLSQAMVICEPIEKDAVMNESPTPRPRLLAVKNCCKPFSMMIDRPKVTISVVSSPRLIAPWMIDRCRMYPMTAISTTTTGIVHSTGMWVTAMTPTPR